MTRLGLFNPLEPVLHLSLPIKEMELVSGLKPPFLDHVRGLAFYGEDVRGQ